MQVFTTLTQSQRNIFSFRWKRTGALYWNLGRSEFPLFVVLLTCCFVVPQMTFEPLLKGHAQSSNVNHCFLLPFKHEDKKELNEEIKGATKLYFMYYSCVVIILFSTGLYKSAFSTCFLVKRGFRLSVF